MRNRLINVTTNTATNAAGMNLICLSFGKLKPISITSQIIVNAIVAEERC